MTIYSWVVCAKCADTDYLVIGPDRNMSPYCAICGAFVPTEPPVSDPPPER